MLIWMINEKYDSNSSTCLRKSDLSLWKLEGCLDTGKNKLLLMKNSFDRGAQLICYFPHLT